MQALTGEEQTRFKESEEAAITQVAQVLELDNLEIEPVKAFPSQYGQASDGHIHDLELVRLAGRHTWLKSEEVFCPSRYGLDYRNFYLFCDSLFTSGEGRTPVRRMQICEEPEPQEQDFHESLLEGQEDLLKAVTDQQDPQTLPAGDLRVLLRLYQSRKARLVQKQGEELEEVYGHHGRGVLNEVIASSLGRLLGVPVPYNRLARRWEMVTMPYQNGGLCQRLPLRMVASEDLSPRGGRNLSQVLLDQLKLQHNSELAGAFDYNWHRANPLRVEALGKEGLAGDKARFALACLGRPQDLARSDFLDRLLGGFEDRKLEEYLLPQGPQGPIYTLDFGEALFPELGLNPDNAAFQEQKSLHLQGVSVYLAAVAQLEPGHWYRQALAPAARQLGQLSQVFFNRWFAALPPDFCRLGWDDPRPNYRAESLIDLFCALRDLILAQGEL